MRIVFFGGGSFGVPALRRLAAEHEIVRVCCPPPRPAGRKMRPLSCAAALAAREMSLPLCEEEAETAQKIAMQCRPDVVVVCDYGQLLKPETLRAPTRGALNIHPSLLPRWRGAAPILRTIWAGDKNTGITIMQMDEGLDTGMIVLQKTIPVAPEMNRGELQALLAEEGAELLLRALRDNPPPRRQSDSGACYAAKLRPADCALDFRRDAAILARQVRALSPSPGARAFCADGETLKIYAARETNGCGAPGEILSADDEIVVACGADALALSRVQRPGRRIMDAAEFLRGRRAPPAFCPPPSSD